MSTDTRQRRGKKSAQNAATGEAALTAAEQIRKAEATILSNRETTAKLYAQWRNYLMKISFLVVLVSFHQAQAPMTGCIKDIKAVNAATDGTLVSWTEAIVMVLHESMCEIVGIVLSAFLAKFHCLNPPGDFASTSYMISAMLVPLQLGLFYQTRRIGCLGEFELVSVTEEVDRKRSFPVALIFHCITSGSYWFMKYGMDQADANLRQLEDLKRQLRDAQNDAKKRSKK